MEEEYKQIWKSAFLTVDTNVLLDLYRHNNENRELLLKSLKDFSGRAWLTRQAAEEFFRHRQKTVNGVSKNFKNAINALESIVASSRQVAEWRSLPKDLPLQFSAKITALVADFVQQIEAAKEAHPDYRSASSDAVLEALCDLFTEVGPFLNAEESVNRATEGLRRHENEIPPGYCDKKKSKERKYGDYLIWREVLDFAKAKQLPVVLVTSEKKEDWWEEIDGQIIGPRREMLRELFEHSQQRVLIYQTDQFAEMAGQMRGAPVEENVLAEIKVVQESSEDVPRIVEIAVGSPGLIVRLVGVGRQVVSRGRLERVLGSAWRVACVL